MAREKRSKLRFSIIIASKPNQTLERDARYARAPQLAALSSMEDFAFTNGGDFIRFAVEVESDLALPSSGDARVSVWLKSEDFEAKNEVWVHRDTLAAICQALVSLERARRGAAKLVSISPGELEISVRTVSGSGAMAVGGACGYPVHRPHGRVFHRLEFGFEFDPSQLIAAVTTPWVHRHAV